MRLKQIKLAGFKSFVDPTAIEVPGQLVGVVGPNGCGKSNIMDAVRWVLGESRASELRGESMQDVIFNGSSERRPAARASVELQFDNTLGRIAGAWGQYAELSVRRVLSRDGQSTYSINGQSVRRRDVHDLFLGTGLGPRAYAIIGQGMISRIIEARPEDLRVFLEEAAGVSRYKERRRETEGRLADTRENLVRVEDIRRELGSQIERLEKQAEVARQFRELESERDRRQQQLWIVRRDEARLERQKAEEAGSAAQLRLEERSAALRSMEAALEALRARHDAAGDELHGVQARFYEANANVSRIEGEIRLVAQNQGQLRERLDGVQEQSRRAAEQQHRASSEMTQVREQLTGAREQSETLAAIVVQGSEDLPALEDRARDARALADEARSQAASVRQAIELSALQSRRAGESLERARQRRERLMGESGALSAFDPAALEDAVAILQEAEDAERQTLGELQATEAQWSELEARRQPARQALGEAEAHFARIDGRIAALRQLQERIESQGKVQPWLQRHGLEALARLWQKLRIDAGWETAVESVLRERVDAREVGRLETAAQLVADAPPAKVGFFTVEASSVSPTAAPAAAITAASPAGLRALSAVVHCGDPGVQALLSDWLAGCFLADSIEEAVRERARLPLGARFVVPQGHVIGRQFLSLYAADSEQEGVLARRHELDNLTRELRAQQMLVEEARGTSNRIDVAASEKQAALRQLRESHHARLAAVAAGRLERQRLEQAQERTRESRERIDGELEEVAALSDELESEIAAETTRFEELDARLADCQQDAESRRSELEQAEAALQEARLQLRERERAGQEAAFGVRSLEASIERLQAMLEQAVQMQAQATEERTKLQGRLDELSDAAARDALENALSERGSVESALGSARERMEILAAQVREQGEQRVSLEREQQPLRDELMQLQLRSQAALLSEEQYKTELMQAGVDDQAEAALRPPPGENLPRPSWLQGEVTRLGGAIGALGAVNLAALDELSQASERKGFLDSQSEDLNEAITTLEDAIRKIDRETRELLQETYDTVNRQFGELFPQLFGGGEARLILTGDEILDAGVQVMAQPPGKRNSSIHLLSGGEKALTAIALVFAMFQLNPAPFCLLDEVDAPLDDANTERYVDIVRRMSEQTQFLFITHNKIAMELAQQLVGVTMQERGVSRIVAVDLESAGKLAEAA